MSAQTFAWAEFSVAHALLRSYPFRLMPLRVRCFQEDIRDTLIQLATRGAINDTRKYKSTSAAVLAVVRLLPPLDSNLDISYTAAGYAASFQPKTGRRQRRRESSEETASCDRDRLDLEDKEFRMGERCWTKWLRLLAQRGRKVTCHLCSGEIDVQVSAEYLEA